jgi:hypothetical protein
LLQERAAGGRLRPDSLHGRIVTGVPRETTL